MNIGILGAAGYTGCELLRLLRGHPVMVPRVVVGRSEVGVQVSDLFPSLGPAGDLVIRSFAESRDELSACDLIFSALPHGQLGTLLAEESATFAAMPRIVDLASDFRLRDPHGYQQWYGAAHPCPDELDRWIYSIPEWHRERARGASRVANAGCFATAFLLAITPLVRAGLVEAPLSGIGISGSSGAGKGLNARLHFSHLHEDIVTYRVGSHQHGGEIEQCLTDISAGLWQGPASLSTVLAPMSRGLQVIVTAPATPAAPEKSVRDALNDAYRDEPFVIVREKPPETKHVRGAHRAEIFANYDPRTGLVTAIGVIDNLVKGAAGSAIQNANLMLGLEEVAGLSREGVYP